jgi:hypothetical protein
MEARLRLSLSGSIVNNFTCPFVSQISYSQEAAEESEDSCALGVESLMFVYIVQSFSFIYFFLLFRRICFLPW